MRPRLLHLGYAAQTAQVEQQRLASMRPRLLHLGYDRVPGEQAFVHDASMRPRLLHLGYAITDMATQTFVPVLQ